MLSKADMVCIPTAECENRTYLLEASPVTTLQSLSKIHSYTMIYGLQWLTSVRLKICAWGQKPKELMLCPNKTNGKGRLDIPCDTQPYSFVPSTNCSSRQHDRSCQSERGSSLWKARITNYLNQIKCNSKCEIKLQIDDYQVIKIETALYIYLVWSVNLARIRSKALRSIHH